MLHKIEYLKSIGKFRDYQARGDVAFNKLTLFYGDNGSGKTTLTAILRSLTQNKPELISRRKSTNQAIPQAAQIVQRTATRDTYHTFNATTGWTAPYPGIEIFDIHFVNENVYSGFDFNDEQKKQLHQFVIGAAGIAIKQQIEQNKFAKTTSRQTQTALEQQIVQQVGNDLTSELINPFLSILPTQANDIDQTIATAETALANARANAIIQTLQPLTQLPHINMDIDFNATIIDLQATTAAIQDLTLKTIFADHCQDLTENTITGPENWLKRGFEFLKRKKAALSADQPTTLSCPFCKQAINDNIDIIKAYALQFNEEFNLLAQRIQTHLTALQNFNLEIVIQNFNNTDTTNSRSIGSWSAHLPSTVQPPHFNIIDNEMSLRAELLVLMEALRQKIQNPTLPVATTSATNFNNYLQAINSNVDRYNQSVIIYNAGITAFCSGIKTVAQAQADLCSYNRIQKRYETAINTLCTQLVAERQNLKTLETEYTLLVQQQYAAAETFFTNYENRINYYLDTVFKTLFRIDHVVHVPPQGKAVQSKISYKLTIDGHDISFDPNQANNAKDCLSEGDKSTIALAFFLSKLDIDPETNNKILVFDDPLSSFDRNRRMYTVQLIKDKFPNIKQIVVLSHKEDFLYELSKCFAASEKKVLRITENYLLKASILEPLNLETLVENEYFKHIKELDNFLQNPDIGKKEIILGWLRNVLEAHIRFKFYRQLSTLPVNDQTFGTLISTLVAQNVIFRNNANRTQIISKLSLINSVSCKPHHGEPTPDFTTVGINPNTMTITELANLVRDTLNLVDNEL